MNVAAKKTKGEKMNLNPKYKYPKHLLKKGSLMTLLLCLREKKYARTNREREKIADSSFIAT